MGRQGPKTASSGAQNEFTRQWLCVRPSHLVLGMRVEVLLERDALAHGQSADGAHGVVHGADGGGLAGPLAAADGANSAQMWRVGRSIGDVKRPSWNRGGKVRVVGVSRDHVTADCASRDPTWCCTSCADRGFQRRLPRIFCLWHSGAQFDILCSFIRNFE